MNADGGWLESDHSALWFDKMHVSKLWNPIKDNGMKCQSRYAIGNLFLF